MRRVLIIIALLCGTVAPPQPYVVYLPRVTTVRALKPTPTPGPTPTIPDRSRTPTPGGE